MGFLLLSFCLGKKKDCFLLLETIDEYGLCFPLWLCNTFLGLEHLCIFLCDGKGHENCISFSHARTKLLHGFLQKFKGTNQSNALLYSTFLTVQMTFSELKIASSVNYQSDLSKGKHLC